MITAKVVKGKEEEATKYRDYFDCSESLKRCNSHRLLAIRRAEAEGLLKVSISRTMRSAWNAGTPIRAEQQPLRTASGRSRAGFLQTPIEAIHRDGIATQSKERADEEAIKVFAENLRQLLLASPLGKSV